MGKGRFHGPVEFRCGCRTESFSSESFHQRRKLRSFQPDSHGMQPFFHAIKQPKVHDPAADINVPGQGLQLLANTDLREQLSQIHCPLLILSGERDKLVPTMAARWLAEKVKHANAVIFKGCGHAPFLSHQSLFMHYLQRFLHE